MRTALLILAVALTLGACDDSLTAPDPSEDAIVAEARKARTGRNPRTGGTMRINP